MDETGGLTATTRMTATTGRPGAPAHWQAPADQNAAVRSVNDA
jgi:hypothetical protein